MIQTEYILPMMLMLIQGIMGALDTLYYHEYRYQLPAYATEARVELYLHGIRDLIYGVLFITLAQVAWGGVWSWVLLSLIGAEVVITVTDFVIERKVRRAWGGLATGELMMHALMAILYGGFIATLSPHWWRWSQLDTGFYTHSTALSTWMVVAMILMGCGVICAGIRDLLLASPNLSDVWRIRLAFPWKRKPTPPRLVQ